MAEATGSPGTTSAPEPFPINGMSFSGIQNPGGSDDFTIEYQITRVLADRLGIVASRSEDGDDVLSIPKPLIDMLQTGPLAPPDGTPPDVVTDQYLKSENGITEIFTPFISKKLGTVAKLAITNDSSMTRNDFITKSNQRIRVIAKCFQIWSLLRGERASTPFIFLGHGGEIPGEWGDRKTLPEGYTLVAFTQCGLATYTDKISNFLNWAKRSQDWSMNPGKHAAEIGKIFETEVRVYEAGDSYPQLVYSPLLSHNSGGATAYARASGFHALPLIVENTMTTPMKVNTTTPLKVSDALSIYSGALYPTVDNIVGKTISDIQKIKIPIETIFGKFGPGVYYWPICRSLEGSTDPSQPPLMRSLSNDQQKRRTERNTLGGKKKRRKTNRHQRQRRR
jgi:hypothetical protein